MIITYTTKPYSRVGQTVPLDEVQDGEAFNWAYLKPTGPAYRRVGNNLKLVGHEDGAGLDNYFKPGRLSSTEVIIFE
jgi:hypothetical protein